MTKPIPPENSPDDLEARRRAANPPRHPGDELLQSGQEEVFSRTEVDRGRIEHEAAAGAHGLKARDEAQTERQTPPDAGPGEPAGGE